MGMNFQISDDAGWSVCLRPDDLISDVLETVEFDVDSTVMVSKDGITVEGTLCLKDIVRGLRYFGNDVLGLQVCDLMNGREKNVHQPFHRAGFFSRYLPIGFATGR